MPSKKLKHPTIEWFREKRPKIGFIMKGVYQIAGVSKQAHHQHGLRQGNWNLLIDALREEVEMIRQGHPGCGLEKIYWILRPNGIGRDRFVTSFKELGYGVQNRKTTIGRRYRPI